jgi:hypothetical protein
VVISDGKETCAGDPCAAVREARAAGVKMQVHVIGFDVTPEESKQLRCIAEAGEGKYFAAKNAPELKQVLTQVKKEVGAAEVKEQVVQAQQSTNRPSQPKQNNLMDSKNGGQVFIAPDDYWVETIDGKEDPVGKKGHLAHLFQPGEEAIFAFKDERPATFDTFSVLIPQTGKNLNEFELFVADEAPTGPFRSIGKFQTVNAKVIAKQGYQEFKFPAVTAKYLKVKLISGHEQGESRSQRGMFLYEFRVLGLLQ